MKSLSLILSLVIIATTFSRCTHTSVVDTNSLKAFKTINESIVLSDSMLDDRNKKMVTFIENERKNQPEKIEGLLDLVKQVRSRTIEMTTYIDKLIRALNESPNDGDYSVVNRLLADGKEGEVLKTDLEAYMNDIDILMAQYKLFVKMPLAIDVPGAKGKQSASSWQTTFFKNVPKIAAIAILNKFNNDIKNTEALSIERVATEAVATDIVVDQFEPVVSAKSKHVRLGDNYEATIELAAHSASWVPAIFVDGKKIRVNTDGKATYIAKATSAGTFKAPIIIQYPSRSAGLKDIKGELQYTVGK